ncbi:MAG: DnaJ domain-containing protein, partial [archaeon]|nr:DnaJ domain-containing protein [archaeon]
MKHDPFRIHPDNYYKILGLEELFLNAKVEDIRKAYKKLAVIYHPDKNKDNISLDQEEEKEESKDIEENKEEEIEKKPMTDEEKKKYEINQKWLKIKEAYENLLDPVKRKKYDSSMMFDDSIPDEDKTYDDNSFFIEFGPVFMKNAIWSKKQPVPKLGDMDSTIDKVKKFYRFWYNFDTWRDFTVEGEYNIDEANSRFEKRQMMKENKKMKSNLHKEEKERISKLVQIAYKNDPRIKIEE